MTSLRTTRMTSLRTTTAIEKKNDTPFYGQGISSNKQQSESSMTTIECVECEGMFAVEDTIIHQQYGEERHWCEECYEEKHTQCDCCEDFFFFEEMTDPMNCDHYYCEECAEREFGTCEECEEACSSDAKYCPDCVEKEEKKIYISKNSNTKSQKIENLFTKEIKASKQQQDEQVKMENTMEGSGIVCKDCLVTLEPHTAAEHLDTNNKIHSCEGGHKRHCDCGCEMEELSKDTNVKKIEVQNKKADISILQEQDEQVKMMNEPTCRGLGQNGKDGCPWGRCPRCDPSLEDTDEDSDEEPICEECFGEMREQMTGGVGEENGWYQCPALSPHEIQNYTVGDLNFCEKHYNKMVEEEKNQNLHLQDTDEDSDEEHPQLVLHCEECFCEMMEQMTGNGVGEENGWYQCPALSPHEIQNCAVGDLNFCEKHYNKMVEEEGESEKIKAYTKNKLAQNKLEKAQGYTQEEADLLMDAAKEDKPDVIAKLGMCKIKKMVVDMEAALIKKGMGEWLHQKKEEIALAQNKETEKELGALQEEVVASGGKVVDASKMTRKEIDELTKEMEAKGFSTVEVKEKGAAWCVMKGCGRSCRKKNDAVGLAHRSTPTHTYPEGSWVCDICWEEKGMCSVKEMLHTTFKEEDGVKCLGCSYTFGEKGFVDIGCGIIPVNLIDLIKPSKKNPDYWCGMCMDDLWKMSEDKELLNPDDEFAFVGRTAGADDGFEPIDELRAKGKKMNKEVKDRCYWAEGDDLARMKGMMEYNDMFLTLDELLRVINGWRFVINKDARIREWKKGNEAEKAAAEVLANAAAFVEEKAEKPKTKKQIQAEATKAANQAVKDKKKAKEEYEKAVIECAKRQAESERLKKEKKYRAKMAKEKAAKKAADAAVCVGCGSAEIAYTDCGGKKGVSMCQDCWT